MQGEFGLGLKNITYNIDNLHTNCCKEPSEAPAQGKGGEHISPRLRHEQLQDEGQWSSLQLANHETFHHRSSEPYLPVPSDNLEYHGNGTGLEQEWTQRRKVQIGGSASCCRTVG